MDPDEEAARLLDRMAGEVPVAPAPVGRVVDAALRRRRRRHLLTATVVLLLAALLLLTLLGAGAG